MIINENFKKPPKEDNVKKQLRFSPQEKVKTIIGTKRNNYLKNNESDDTSSVASNYTDQGNIVIGGKKKKMNEVPLNKESSSSLSD